jgi:predicted transcriptional regulator
MNLQPETNERIATLLRSSGLTTGDQLVNTALDVLEDAWYAERLLLEKIDEGIADAEAGRLIPASEVFAELRARHAARSSQVE